MSENNGRPMPALFLGHGSPMNAIEDNRYSRAWADLAARLPRPQAILAISAHWYTRGSFVLTSARPRTIHDFGGFPQALFDIQYPAAGAPDLAKRIIGLLAPDEVVGDDAWGLDHGSWSLLVKMYPQADVPVLQLSIDARQPARWHYQLARRLSPLREESVLVLGSGNVVHNLGRLRTGGTDEAHPWAQRFEERIRAALIENDHGSILRWIEEPDADTRLGVPTADHFLPLLYVAALQRDGETAQFPVDGIDLGSISMLSVRYG